VPALLGVEDNQAQRGFVTQQHPQSVGGDPLALTILILEDQHANFAAGVVTGVAHGITRKWKPSSAASRKRIALFCWMHRR